jgi:small subunit ribosomal protein S6
MKRYEGLFVLNTSAKEEGIKEIIDHVSADITAAGGKIETVQKMDKRPFSRVADKKFTSGFYVNVIFEAPAPTIAQLNHRFGLSEDVFRVLFTEAPQVAAPKAA